MNEFVFQINGSTLSCINYPDAPSFCDEESKFDWFCNFAEELNEQAHNYLVEEGFEDELIYGFEYSWEDKACNNLTIVIETSLDL